MAQAETVKDQLLTCCICSDIYTNPCTLGCGHTFCRKCLTQFIETRPGDIMAKHIPCAYCRQVHRVPNPRAPVEDWAGQFKPSILMQGLMDIMLVDKQDGETGHSVCFLCGEIGETTSATMWCSECQMALCKRCSKQHVKTPSMNEHDVHRLTGDEPVERTRRRTCPEHHGEHIKFVCKDCDKPVCQECCIVEHRSCSSVVTIASMVPEMNARLDSLKLLVQRNIKDNAIQCSKEEARINDITKSKEAIDSKIHETIDQAVALLKEKEEQLMHELSAVTDEKKSYHHANIKSLQIAKQMYQQHEAFIEQAQLSQSVAELFNMYQTCTSGVLGAVDGGAPEEKPMRFVQNMAPLRKAIEGIGVLTTSDSIPTLRTVGMNSPMQQCDIIDLKHETDSQKPDPLDILVMSVNGERVLVVVDFKNVCLKSVYRKNGIKYMFVDALKLDCLPLRLTKLTGSRVAVTVGDSRILIIDVKPQLVFVTDLKTKNQYWGLTGLDDSTLVVGIKKRIDILDLHGNVIRSFKSPGDITPYYLATTPEGNIVGTGSSGVFGVTPLGEAVFVIGSTVGCDLDKPYGVTATASHIFVADPGAMCIHHISPSGSYLGKATTFQDGEDVWGVYLFDQILYAGDRNGHINVYK